MNYKEANFSILKGKNYRNNKIQEFVKGKSWLLKISVKPFTTKVPII